MNRLLTRSTLLVAVVAPLLAGCVDKQDTQSPAPTPANDTGATPPDDNTAQRRMFEDRLLEIAAAYEPYGRLDTAARWAPAFCAAPVMHLPELALSRSTDQGTHGRKLYSLFPKERDPSGSYVESAKPGQVIVKESWVPEEVNDDGKPLEPIHRKVKVRRGDAVVEQDDSFIPYARKDGKLYHAKEKGPLFVMFKLDPQTPGTDEGWVYGTVTPDGKQVTSAGRVESCMKCHQEAPHDRLFGLPEPK
jgi:hypothetical protein